MAFQLAIYEQRKHSIVDDAEDGVEFEKDSISRSQATKQMLEGTQNLENWGLASWCNG